MGPAILSADKGKGGKRRNLCYTHVAMFTLFPQVLNTIDLLMKSYRLLIYFLSFVAKDTGNFLMKYYMHD